ncbi:IRK-interacting protein isoform X1 [Iris pallida]|uniref:IRK-interacting protein isoform X1 n=1 Tax=Iris pallida TaxID=29817 RepID=A0AAX6HJQ2_IRIPA|nr:IRK-interacting protein isoform X1 [Iris pallida]
MRVLQNFFTDRRASETICRNPPTITSWLTGIETEQSMVDLLEVSLPCACFRAFFSVSQWDSRLPSFSLSSPNEDFTSATSDTAASLLSLASSSSFFNVSVERAPQSFSTRDTSSDPNVVMARDVAAGLGFFFRNSHENFAPLSSFAFFRSTTSRVVVAGVQAELVCVLDIVLTMLAPGWLVQDLLWDARPVRKMSELSVSGT